MKKDLAIKIRKLILADKDLVKELIISSRDIAIIDFIKTYKIGTSAEIADHFKVSLPAMSVALKKLYSKGYLSRKEVTAETGGIEFLYKV